MLGSNGGGTLPRSSPRKLMLDAGLADKSATLTRQQSKQKSTLAKVSSSVELAVLGYNSASSSPSGNMAINGNAERDRCINAVIVSPRNMFRRFPKIIFR